jgi:hypothetical protein
MEYALNLLHICGFKFINKKNNLGIALNKQNKRNLGIA